MNTIPAWREQLNRLWTVRAALFAALLACADQLLAPFVGTLPPVLYALLYALIILLRVWQQAAPPSVAQAPANNADPDADPEATTPGPR